MLTSLYPIYYHSAPLQLVSSSHVIFLASALARSRVYSLSLPEPNTTSFLLTFDITL
jgi:hypothetical protein